MINVLFLCGFAVIAVLVVSGLRRQHDRMALARALQERGGALVRVRRTKRHPFHDTGRGWWVWEVYWRDGQGVHRSWALTTREGIKEWRD